MSAIDRYDDDSAASEGPAEMTDLVSVIIPCYNYAQYLGEAIGSVLSQTYPHVEIIVVDDGSVDDTRDVATRFRGVRYIYQRNQGLSAARNTGLRESRGAFIGFLDADDRLMPDALRIGVEYLYAHPDCAFVSGQVGLIAEDGSLLSTPQETVPGAYHYAELLRHNYIWTLAAVVYRRFVFASIGGFDTSLAACEDYDVSLRIAREFPVGCHGEAVAEYRQHGSNMTRNTAKMMASVFTVLRSQRSFIGGDRSRRWAY
jgi:glycosyltransferase involved in cell wall biosynthesis